jgi:hypothetical protein
MMQNLTKIKPKLEFRAMRGWEGGEVSMKKPKQGGSFWSDRLIKQFQYKYYSGKQHNSNVQEYWHEENEKLKAINDDIKQVRNEMFQA